MSPDSWQPPQTVESVLSERVGVGLVFSRLPLHKVPEKDPLSHVKHPRGTHAFHVLPMELKQEQIIISLLGSREVD